MNFLVNARRADMTISRKALCVAYGLIAVVSLVGTWGNILEYLHAGFVGV